MSVAQINSNMAAASAALLDGDYATALTYALAAQALCAAMPRMSHGSATGRNELEYSQQGIAAFIANLQRARAGAAGIQSSLITRHAPDCPSDDACLYTGGAYL